ncbi:MAG: glycoside hydrolase family 4 [Chitinivibrionales bacterium]|nr:glycoside hydrolase family 4 [Chitinivibrionales bacterium]
MARIQHPKVVVIGAGSLFFGRQAIWQMVHSPHLREGTLGLVDTDAERLEKMAALARNVISNEGVPLRLEASVDRREVLDGADFVVLSFADRSVMFRGIDCEVSVKYGVRMCSGDTIGPGGIFRTLRELPEILACARDIERQCPDAWVINYINPTAANGIGLMRHAPSLKTFALCDGLHMPHVKKRYAVRAGIVDAPEHYTDDIDRRFDMRIAGVNHFTWMVRAAFDGEDIMPAIAESLRREAARETDGGDAGAKAAYNSSIGYELYRAFGCVPTCVGHTKEYVRFWQGKSVAAESIPQLSIWDTETRYARHDDMWRQVDSFNTGATPVADYMRTFGPDHATDIIENMVAGLGKPFYINTPNRGAVTNMADDAFLELLCDIDMDGPRPREVGPFPRGIWGMQQTVLDTHELTVEAAVTGDRDLLRRAMLTDPMMTSIADADAIVDELLEREREALPDWHRDSLAVPA